MKSCVLCGGRLHDEHSNVCYGCWDNFRRKSGSSGAIQGVVESAHETIVSNAVASSGSKIGDERLRIDLEKLSGKLELVEGFKSQINDRIARLSEEIGDLRRMILDREKGTQNMESVVQKMKDIFETVKPQMIDKKIQSVLTEVEKNKAITEKNASLFKNIGSELSQIRETFSKIKDFDNVVEMHSKIQEQLHSAEDTKRYSDRVASKVESVFSELKEKFDILQHDIKTIEKVDDLTSEMVKDLGKLKLQFEEEHITEKDLAQLREELTRDFKVIKPDELPEAYKSQVAEIEGSLKELEKKIIYISEGIDESQKGDKQIEQNLESKLHEVERGLTSRIEQLSVTVMGIDELEKERQKILKLLRRAQEDFSNGHISRKAFEEIKQVNTEKLEHINAVLERVSKEMIYQQLKGVRKEIEVLSQKTAQSAKQKEFTDLEKQVVHVQKRMVELDQIRNLQAPLSENFEVLTDRIRSFEEEHLKLQEHIRDLVGKMAYFDHEVEKNHLLEKDFSKLTENVSQKTREILELRKELEKANGQVFQINRHFSDLLQHVEDFKSREGSLKMIVSKFNDRLGVLEKNTVSQEDIKEVRQELESAIEKNVGIMDALLHKIGA